MRSIFFNLVCLFFFNVAFAQKGDPKVAVPDSTKKIVVMEAACGECQFKLEGKGCNLAVRIDNKAYFVDGTAIDSHGDAHAKDGFCNAVRKAEVQGQLVDDRYKITYFKLLKNEEKKEPVANQKN